jgi:hypothetical protein
MARKVTSFVVRTSGGKDHHHFIVNADGRWEYARPRGDVIVVGRRDASDTVRPFIAWKRDKNGENLETMPITRIYATPEAAGAAALKQWP